MTAYPLWSRLQTTLPGWTKFVQSSDTIISHSLQSTKHLKPCRQAPRPSRMRSTGATVWQVIKSLKQLSGSFWNIWWTDSWRKFFMVVRSIILRKNNIYVSTKPLHTIFSDVLKNWGVKCVNLILNSFWPEHWNCLVYQSTCKGFRVLSMLFCASSETRCTLTELRTKLVDESSEQAVYDAVDSWKNWKRSCLFWLTWGWSWGASATLSKLLIKQQIKREIIHLLHKIIDDRSNCYVDKKHLMK